tara:strand:+ start:2097 stop:2876 length:780 start_codon:yes stop_codon:yes gene_type:complete
MNILNEICINKKKEIKKDKEKYSLDTLEKITKIIPNSGFRNLLISSNKSKQNNIIAEIKKSSPSAGTIIDDYDPVKIAQEYRKAGISALSILTDKKYFEGNLEHISLVKKIIDIPILRKDFIIDPYQVIQSKYYKADAILVIMSILSNEQAAEIINVAKKYQIDCLIEVHNEKEINNALKLNSDIIGINNRNLDNLEVDLKNVNKLISLIPEKFTIIAESGIKNKEDINEYNKLGIYNFLIGETLLKSKDIKNKVSELI